MLALPRPSTARSTGCGKPSYITHLTELRLNWIALMRGHAASSGCQPSRDLRFEPPLVERLASPRRSSRCHYSCSHHHVNFLASKISLRYVALSESSLACFGLQMSQTSLVQKGARCIPSLVSSMDRTRFAASTRMQYRLIDCARATIGLSAHPAHLIPSMGAV